LKYVQCVVATEFNFGLIAAFETLRHEKPGEWQSQGEGMKRAGIIIMVMLGVSVWCFGQGNEKPASTPPTGQAAAAPQGKRPPAAKTQPEFDAYKAAAALPDPAAQEKAADDFAAKFADSELRAVLYKVVMHGYQQANNADKMMEMGRKVLGSDADERISGWPRQRKTRNALW
jgi:hypothetical protein